MADPVGSLKQIAEVALKIKEAVETVRQNKEDCLRIGRRVTRVSDILSQLQNTEMTNNPAMSAALDELDETLRRAHTLVTACQEENIMCLFCTATKLSKQLRRVKDDISEHLMEGIFATNVQVTIILTRIQDDDAHPLLAQTEETHPQQMQTLRSADAANIQDDDAHPLLAQTEETHAQQMQTLRSADAANIQDDDAHPLLAQTEETHPQHLQTLRSADAANIQDDDTHPLLAQTEETHAQQMQTLRVHNEGNRKRSTRAHRKSPTEEAVTRTYTRRKKNLWCCM